MNENSWTCWFNRAMAPEWEYNYARSGATWTNTRNTRVDAQDSTALLGDQNVMLNQVYRLAGDIRTGRIAAPDMVILAAGTNDAWFGERRPHALDITAEELMAMEGATVMARPMDSLLTIAECMYVSINTLRRVCPDARIVVLTPMLCKATTPERIHRVGDLIESVARAMHVECIRQDNTDYINRDVELREYTRTLDGTHTNAAGARQVATQLLTHIIH